ncbi:MAG: tRNA (adenosine(37)-N6)-threonylcarbamoyltransferase complex dimerization subunit type 1 TsaB [Elusimicrobia bacterium]|nr:tRNA (adenosine(37)-N6)-threonylcarbamoyltransferase complex dimerization subunit type 1 TsaB [Elusimicrobiota bacterium]
MRILAVDTTSDKMSVAFFDGKRVFKRAAVADGDHDDRLFPEVRKVLAAARRKLADVEAFAAARGPGSFTGIRVGMTFVSVLSRSFGRPAVGVTLFDAEAHRAARKLKTLAPGRRLGAVFPARRGELFFQAFELGAAGEPPRPLEAPAWLAPADWPIAVKRLAGGHAMALAGPAAKDAREALGASRASFDLLRTPPLTAADLIGPAQSALGAPAVEFSPLYLKPAYYERAAG